MKLEQINLLLVESKEGVAEVLDMEKVKRVVLMINSGLVEMDNGIVKLLDLKSARKAYRWMTNETKTIGKRNSKVIIW